MTVYVKIYDDETKWMYFLIEDGELFKRYNRIGNKVRSIVLLKNNLIENQSTIKIILKAKTKSFGDEVTDFYDKEMVKVHSK